MPFESLSASLGRVNGGAKTVARRQGDGQTRRTAQGGGVPAFPPRACLLWQARAHDMTIRTLRQSEKGRGI